MFTLEKGKLKPVIDDRNTMLGEKYYRDFFKSLKNSDSLKSFLIKTNSQYIMIPKNEDRIGCFKERLAGVYDFQFILQYEDDKVEIYEIQK